MKNHVANANMLLPVVRRPRASWTIPPVDAAERLEKERREEERRKALIEGTTSDGRILWCMMNDRARKMIESGVHSAEEVVAMIEGEINEFPMLRSEWAIMFARPRGLGVEHLLHTSARSFAIFIHFAHQLELLARQQAGDHAPSPKP